MFGTILSELFPSECLVLEIVPNTRYVYPIFKNGSTSLNNSGYKKLSLDQIAQIKTVEIYIRDPHKRFISGVQTYLSKLDSTMNKDTALFLIEKYLYFNRHFCPQLLWLVNFRRFSNANYTIKPIDQLCEITTLQNNQSTVDIDLINRFSNNSKVKFYNEMDEVLTVNLIGKTVSLEEIFSVLKSNYGNLYHDAFGKLKDIVNVVP